MPYVTKNCAGCGVSSTVYHNSQFCKKCGGRLSQSYDSPEVEIVDTPAAAPEPAAAGTSLATCVSDIGDDLSLVARNADEMKAATGAMAKWFRAKEEIARRDVAELNDAACIAAEKGWKTSPLDRQAKTAERRARFYEKCALA